MNIDCTTNMFIVSEVCQVVALHFCVRIRFCEVRNYAGFPGYRVKTFVSSHTQFFHVRCILLCPLYTNPTDMSYGQQINGRHISPTALRCLFDVELLVLWVAGVSLQAAHESMKSVNRRHQFSVMYWPGFVVRSTCTVPW